MKRLHYSISINAPVDKVIEIMNGKETYNKWACAFSKDSTYRGTFKLAETIDFIDPNMGGTRAIIEVLEHHKRTLLKHVALISKEGEVSTQGPMADKWIGTTEEYIFKEEGATTTLDITIETDEQFVNMFESTWPKALDNLKRLCESTS